MQKPHFALVAVLSLAGMACASAPAAPFDTLKTSNVTAFRLQNYEPPPPAPGAVPAAPGAAIPGLPPEINAWIQQGASGLTQLIPPGLLPPGMVPGAPAAAPPPPDAPRFHSFRIVAQTQVIDPELKEDLGKMLGDADNFSQEDARCAPGVIYPETGISFSPGPGAQANDVLISLACNQIVSRSFAWPHPATGMTHGGVDKLREILMKIWPAGA
jgi:hypothetical protein